MVLIGEKSAIPYIAGYIAGDGHLVLGNNGIRLSSSKKIFAEQLREILSYLGYKSSIFWDEGGNVWRVSFYSKYLRNILTEKYGIPAGAKSKIMIAPVVAKEEIKYFLAGLFDAEGWHELDKNKYIRFRLKMANESYINFINSMLLNMHIEAKSHKRTDGSFVVEINKQREIKKFLQNIILLHPKWRQFYGYL